jgi:hypothetical protein
MHWLSMTRSVLQPRHTWTLWSKDPVTNSPVSTGYHSTTVTVKACAPGAVRLTCMDSQALSQQESPRCFATSQRSHTARADPEHGGMLRWVAIHTIGRLCNIKCCQRSCGSANVACQLTLRYDLAHRLEAFRAGGRGTLVWISSTWTCTAHHRRMLQEGSAPQYALGPAM